MAQFDYKKWIEENKRHTSLLNEQNWSGEACDNYLPLNDPSCMKCLSNQAAGISNPGNQLNVIGGIYAVGPDCDCCRDEHRGDLDCINNPTENCWICREPNPNAQCTTLSNAGITVAQALAANLNLYNNAAACHAAEACEPITHSNQCDPNDGTYYGFNPGDPQNDPNHNERWGSGCYFCKEDAQPGCTSINSPVLQGEAFAAYQAGTSNIYPPGAAGLASCNAIEKCDQSDLQIECHKCNMGYPVANMFPGPNCPQGWTLAALFNPKQCKKPNDPIPTDPVLQAKTMPNLNRAKFAIREILNKINPKNKK